MAMLTDAYLNSVGNDFSSFIHFLDTFCIIGGISEDEYEEAKKIVENAAKKMRKGKMPSSVFDKEAMRTAILENDIPMMYVNTDDDMFN